MKKTIFSLISILALLLTACAGTAGETSSSTSSEKEAALADAFQVDSGNTVAVKTSNIITVAAQDNTNDGQDGERPDDMERSVSEQEQIIIGIFELEDTDLAVTSEQAASLLPLLNSLLEFSQVSGPQGGNPEEAPQEAPEEAPEEIPAEQQEEFVEPENNMEEINAVYEEIQAVLTDEQIQAITSLELSQEDVNALMEELGVEMDAGMQPGSAGPGGEAREDGEGTPPEGAPSGEEMPAPDKQDGEMPAEGEGGQPGGGGGRGGFSMVSNALLEALIALLETI